MNAAILMEGENDWGEQKEGKGEKKDDSKEMSAMLSNTISQFLQKKKKSA